MTQNTRAFLEEMNDLLQSAQARLEKMMNGAEGEEDWVDLQSDLVGLVELGAVAHFVSEVESAPVPEALEDEEPDEEVVPMAEETSHPEPVVENTPEPVVETPEEPTPVAPTYTIPEPTVVEEAPAEPEVESYTVDASTLYTEPPVVEPEVAATEEEEAVPEVPTTPIVETPVQEVVPEPVEEPISEPVLPQETFNEAEPAVEETPIEEPVEMESNEPVMEAPIESEPVAEPISEIQEEPAVATPENVDVPQPPIETPVAEPTEEKADFDMGQLKSDMSDLGMNPEGDGVSVNEKIGEIAPAENDLATKLQKQPVADLKSAIALNDRFQYVNDLFGGSMEAYNMAIDELNNLNNMDEALTLVRERGLSDANPESLASFMEVVERRYL